MTGELLKIVDLKKYYPIRSGILSKHVGDVKAVLGVSLKIKKGETLGLVGRSGCGKTTLGKVVMRLEEPTAGQVLFEGRDVFSFDDFELGRYRRKVQMIFQNPQGALDPRMTVGDSICEALIIHGYGDDEERQGRVGELLEEVGLEAEHAFRYPHEFSGGQRQRVGIARALALRPSLIVADEPVSALDISIQAQILNLLKELQKKRDLSYLFIAHDMGVIRYMSDRVAVMEGGRIVEEGTVEEIFDSPQHPFTRTLLSAVPVPNPHERRLKKR
ncbi:MAG: ATP-binding cassette domain-containing protein [Candidatus Hydrothermarchaeaceae archaeon]